MSALAALLASALAPGPALSQDGYAPLVHEPDGGGEAAIAAMQLPEGWRAELWAEEPLLANPVCLWVNERGECYVGETFRHTSGVLDMRDFRSWLAEDLGARRVADRVAMMERHEPERMPEWSGEHDRLRLLRDTDGDGRADEALVFADGFDGPATGIGAGVLEHAGNVYYTCIPDLWRLRDADGDGVAEEREALSSGYGVHIALLGHDLHGLRIGPDGRLYFSSGDRGFTVETPQGLLEHPDTGAVLRCELDGTGLELVHTGLRNPQELAFDELGNLFTGDNNSDSVDRARFVQIVEGANSGWRYSFQWMEGERARGPWNEEKLWYPAFEGQAAYLFPPIEWLGNGPSGLTYDPGTGLPPEYRRHFFLADFRGGRSYSGIHAFDLEPAGAGFRLGEVEPFLWSALPVDCDFGPGGALWFCDWVEGWSKTGRGRVYRLIHDESAGTELVRSTRARLAAGFGALDGNDLFELLRHDDRRVRLGAQFELVGREAAGHEVLLRAALEPGPLLRRLHGIFGTGQAARLHGAPHADLIALLEDPVDEVRGRAAAVLGELGAGAAEAQVLALLNDGNARVRYFAAEAAGRLQLAAAVEPLTALVAEVGEEDRVLRHTALFALARLVEDPTPFAAHPSVEVRAGIAAAMRHRASFLGAPVDPASLAPFLADPQPRVALEAARVFDVLGFDHPALAAAAPGWSPDLESAAAHADGGRGFAVPFWRRVLSACLHRGDEAAARRLAELALDPSLPVDLRTDALTFLGHWEAPPAIDYLDGRFHAFEPRGGRFLPALADAIQGSLAELPDEVVGAWIAFALGKASAPEPAWAELVQARERSSAVRIAALHALSERRAAGLRELVNLGLSDPDAALRAAAMEVLEELDPAEALELLPAILAGGERAERRAAYRILSRAADARADELLAQELARLASGLFPAELQLDLERAVEERGTPTLSAALAAWRAPREAADPELAPWLAGLFGGEAERGRLVFERADLSCLRCHSPTVEEGAQRVGPDLAGIGLRSTRLQLLETLVAPNRSIAPGYQATVLFLEEGGSVAGRIVEEKEGVVSVLDSEGELTRVARDAIELERPDLSAMPEGLTETLSREDLRDLIEYLASL